MYCLYDQYSSVVNIITFEGLPISNWFLLQAANI